MGADIFLALHDTRLMHKQIRNRFLIQLFTVIYLDMF